MTMFWLLLIVVYVLAALSRSVAVPSLPSALGPAAVRPDKLLTCLIIAAFVALSGLRNNIGDTFFYMYSYKLNNFTWAYILANKDIGFGVLQAVLKQISEDPQLLIFASALITNVLIVLVIYKYSTMFELSLYMYITSGLYMTSMNGLRQFLAAAAIFAASKFLFEGKWKLYMATVAIASTFHGTALIFIPIYFLVRRKAWTRTTFMLLAMAMLLVVGFNQFTQILFTALKDTQYGDYQSFHERGANVIRVAVDAVPLLIAFLGRNKMRSLYAYSDIVVNMSILNLVFMVIATQNWIFARFSLYFGLYNVILIAWIVRLFVPKDRKLVYFLILAFYCIYFFYENGVVLGLVYKSSYFG